MSTSGYFENRLNRSGEPRVYITGTRLRVQDIGCAHDFHGESAEEIARNFPQLSLAQVFAALSYYYDHRETILAELKADAGFAESLRQELTGDGVCAD